MNSRQRFLETMRYGAPDRVPYFVEGIRDTVLDEWRTQGLPPDADLFEVFDLDQREEIALDLDHDLSLVDLSTSSSGLETLRRCLNPNDPDRLPEGWPERLSAWQGRDHTLMLEVHEGFFLSMGVGGWSSFSDAIYLLADQPEFVRQALLIQGECAAQLAEWFLKDVHIDAAIFSEPIGGNHGALISPRTYREFVLASYKPILDVLARYGVETIVFRTYANTRALLPEVFQAGFNCLWACECNPRVMDYGDLRREFGRDLRLIAGIDVDVVRQGKDAIRRELESKVPSLLAEGGYVPLADGRIREGVPFENYRYYRQLLEEITKG